MTLNTVVVISASTIILMGTLMENIPVMDTANSPTSTKTLVILFVIIFTVIVLIEIVTKRGNDKEAI